MVRTEIALESVGCDLVEKQKVMVSCQACTVNDVLMKKFKCFPVLKSLKFQGCGMGNGN